MSTELAIGVLVATAASCVAAAAATAIGLVALSTDAPIARRALAQRIVILVALIGGFGVLLRRGTGEEVLDAVLPGGGPETIGLLAIGTVILALFVSIPGIAIGQLFPVVQRARAGDASWRLVAGGGLVNASVLLATVSASFVAYAVVLVVRHPAVLVAVPVAGAYVGAALLPSVILRTQSTGRPTGDERSVIDQAIELTGFPAERVVVLESLADGDGWRPFTRGVPPTTRVFVPEECFDRYDDEMLRALLVAMTRPPRLRIARIVVHGGFFGVTMAAFVAFEELAATSGADAGVGAVLGVLGLMLFALTLPLVGPLVGKRLVYRDDQRLAEVLGPDALRTMLERLDEERGGVELGPLQRHLLMDPGVENRITRIRRATNSDRSSQAADVEVRPGPGTRR